MLKINILVLSMMLMLLTSSGAQQLSSYNMQFLPQRNYMNPSFVPHGKFHIGIPVVSGIGYSYSNNGFRYSDLFRRDDNDRLLLDAGKAIDKLNSRNFLSLHAQMEILSFGMKSGKNYFILNVSEKADINFGFSKSLMEFLYEGNAST